MIGARASPALEKWPARTRGAPSAMTHFPVTALRSVDLETPDIGRSEQFYTSVWGLDLVTRHEGVTYLRASGTDHHVVALRQAERPALQGCHVSAAFRCGIRGDRRGITAAWGDAAPRSRQNSGPDGGTVMTIRAPGGGVLRFVHQDMRHAASLPSVKPANETGPRQSQRH